MLIQSRDTVPFLDNFGLEEMLRPATEAFKLAHEAETEAGGYIWGDEETEHKFDTLKK